MGIFFDYAILDVTTFLVIIVSLLYYYLTARFSYWEDRNIPYVKPKVFYGNFKDLVLCKRSQPEILSDLYHHFKKQGLRYGGVFQLREPGILVTSPEILQDIFIKDFPAFHDRGFVYDEHFDPLTANLLFLEGQKWKYLRSKLMTTFSSGKLKTMLPIVRESADTLMTAFGRAAEKGTVLELRETFAQYTTDVIGSCAFGLQFNSIVEDGNSEFRRMGRKVLEASAVEKILQIVRNVYPRIYRFFKLRFYDKETTEFFTKTVIDTMEYRRKNKIVRKDFMDNLMKIRETEAENLKNAEEMQGVANYNTAVDASSIELTDEVVAAQAFVFFLAGFETSSTTLSYCCDELARHPEVQDRLMAELDAVKQKHGDFTYEALQDLKYMQQVLDETLRMYPPAQTLFRRVSKRYKLPDHDVYLEPGTMVFIPAYAIHYDADYFADPQTFSPDRFSEENKPHLTPNAYMPFGQGPRICIGMRFGMLEMKLCMSLLLSKYRVVQCPETIQHKTIDPRSLILMPHGGIFLKVVKRQ